MAKQRSTAMADIGAVAANAAVSVEDLESADVYVFGTFVATAQVQESPDGTNFVNVGSALTAAGKVAISKSAKSVRVDVTAYTSGTVKSAAAGRDDDRLG